MGFERKRSGGWPDEARQLPSAIFRGEQVIVCRPWATSRPVNAATVEISYRRPGVNDPNGSTVPVMARQRPVRLQRRGAETDFG